MRPSGVTFSGPDKQEILIWRDNGLKLEAMDTFMSIVRLPLVKGGVTRRLHCVINFKTIEMVALMCKKS
jgi:hypothetical protein